MVYFNSTIEHNSTLSNDGVLKITGWQKKEKCFSTDVGVRCLISNLILYGADKAHSTLKPIKHCYLLSHIWGEGLAWVKRFEKYSKTLRFRKEVLVKQLYARYFSVSNREPKHTVVLF